MRKGGRSFAVVTSMIVLALGLSSSQAAHADAQTFSNTQTITLPGQAEQFDYGPGAPYPSPIAVSGLSGTISKVTVSLSGISYPTGYPSNLHFMVEDPAGTGVFVEGGDGGSTAVNNVNLTFDDAAANGLPPYDTMVSGTYKPYDTRQCIQNVYTNADLFPSPAPACPWHLHLADFNGSDPNGTWNLFTFNADVHTGQIAGGWSVSITTTGGGCTASCTTDWKVPFTITQYGPSTRRDLAGFTTSTVANGELDFHKRPRPGSIYSAYKTEFQITQVEHVESNEFPEDVEQRAGGVGTIFISKGGTRVIHAPIEYFHPFIDGHCRVRSTNLIAGQLNVVDALASGGISFSHFPSEGGEEVCALDRRFVDDGNDHVSVDIGDPEAFTP